MWTFEKEEAYQRLSFEGYDNLEAHQFTQLEELELERDDFVLNQLTRIYGGKQ